jgi:hypothetical protein
MDPRTVQGMLEQHFEHGRSDPARAHEKYREDAVLEFPQSGERFVGVENFREWRSSYPASTVVEFREVRGEGDHSVVELRDEKIARESIYVTEPWEAPEWRARWRAAP